MSTNVRRLEMIAKTLVADGKGILAADETVGTSPGALKS
jgi:fructose-bisphosphate aldolase class 1